MLDSCQKEIKLGLIVDPEAVAYEFYGWLMALYGWLAGLSWLS